MLKNYGEILILATTVSLINMICFFIFNYLKGYGNKKGENFATKEDFNTLLKQVVKTTEATEMIKASINANFLQEENKRIHIQSKLEEICLIIIELEQWIEKHTNTYIYITLGDKSDIKTFEEKRNFHIENSVVNNPLIGRIEVLCTIYFSKSIDDYISYKSHYYKYLENLMAISNEKSETENRNIIATIHTENKTFTNSGIRLINSLLKNS